MKFNEIDKHIYIYIYIYIFFVPCPQESFDHKRINDMAVTELEDEDNMYADAKAENDKDVAPEKKRGGGRMVAPIYLRRADLARYVQGKRVQFADLQSKASEELSLHKASADKTLLDKDEKLPSDVSAALEAASQAHGPVPSNCNDICS